ncbi:MAG: DNA-binding protein WhiA [Firmicutes bacterium]|nr:DNA-binding protein WhiA [Bacillota bacterium]
MSFSSDVKRALLEYFDNNRHCDIAELAAVINYECKIEGKSILLDTENKDIAEKFAGMSCRLFGIKTEIYEENKHFGIKINENDSLKILTATGIMNDDEIKKHINSTVVSGVCCKRAYIRGAFICIGSINDPQKNYHLEFVTYEREQAEELKNLINFFISDAKVIERKRQFVVYIKDGEQIVDMLNVMNAHKALMELENVRIVKDVRNNVNRIVNCETANLNKTVSASVRQREAIEYIRSRVGLDELPPQLKEIAVIRLENPDMSLKELGEMLEHPVGKSGVNHRLKKIINIAEHLHNI